MLLKDSTWKFVDPVTPSNFKNYLEELAVYLDAPQLVTHFKNLLYIAQQDLSLAHCIHHSHVARIAVKHSRCHSANVLLDSNSYHDIVGCYSAFKAIDTVTLTNNKLNGVKGWLSNIECANFLVLQTYSADQEKFNVYLNLNINPCNQLKNHPDAIGMKGAKPGGIVIDNVDIEACAVLGRSENPETFATSNYASYAFITNHLGLILGLYSELLSYDQANDIRLENQRRTLELKIAGLHQLWALNLDSVNQSLGDDEFWHKRNTQFALSKEILLNLITFILELGIHNFIDDSKDTSTRFKDAITFVTHMKSLYKANKESIYFKG